MLVGEGDIAAAVRIADEIKQSNAKDSYSGQARVFCLCAIAKAQIKAGKLEDALETTQSLSWFDGGYYFVSIAEAYVARGDMNGYRETRRICGEILGTSWCIPGLQARLGDLEGAMADLSHAADALNRSPDDVAETGYIGYFHSVAAEYARPAELESYARSLKESGCRGFAYLGVARGLIEKKAKEAQAKAKPAP